MTAVSILSIIGLLISSICMKQILDQNSSKQFFYPIFIFTIIVLSVFTFTLITTYSIKLNFTLALLFTFLILNYLLLLLMFVKPVHHLALILLPLTAAIVGITLISDFQQSSHEIDNNLLLHVIVSLVSYGLLGLAAIQALLLKFQERKLKRLESSMLSNLLPPMELMEKIMFDLIVIGFLLLTLSLMTGAPFVSFNADNLTLQKISFSIIAWVVYSYLIYQRYSSNVSGKKATNLAISGMLFLFIAYIGTKTIFGMF